jgi:hypothetical protein
MNVERPLLEWARRFQTTCRECSWQNLREKMEATLLPMVRCALKTGLGQPPLVRWVTYHKALLTADQQNDPAHLARSLARELSEHLMARLAPLPQRETVLGV